MREKKAKKKTESEKSRARPLRLTRKQTAKNFGLPRSCRVCRGKILLRFPLEARFCVTGNAYLRAVRIPLFVRLGAGKPRARQRRSLLLRISEVRSARDNQILARRNCPHEGGRAEKATSRGARRRRHPRSYRASRGEARPTPARARPPRGRVWCGNARKSPKGRVGRLLGIGDCGKTRGPHVFRAFRPRLGSSACVINDVRARCETPGVEREERDGVFRPLRPLEDRVRRASRIQLTGRGGAARERRAPVVRARGTAPPKFLRARAPASLTRRRATTPGAGAVPRRRPGPASRPPVVRISSEANNAFFLSVFSLREKAATSDAANATRPVSF